MTHSRLVCNKLLPAFIAKPSVTALHNDSVRLRVKAYAAILLHQTDILHYRVIAHFHLGLVLHRCGFWVLPEIHTHESMLSILRLRSYVRLFLLFALYLLVPNRLLELKELFLNLMLARHLPFMIRFLLHDTFEQ